MNAGLDSTAAIRAATVKTISKHAGTVLEQLEREGDQQVSYVFCDCSWIPFSERYHSTDLQRSQVHDKMLLHGTQLYHSNVNGAALEKQPANK
jgi:hypothetical protein